MTLKLIHHTQSRSLRVVWTLYELGVEAEIVSQPMNHAALKEPEYKKLNPLGKTPVFFDGEERLVESTAIMEYVANKYAGGKLTRGPQDRDYGKYLQWLHFGEGGMGPYVGMLVGQTVILPEEQRIPAMKAWAEKECANTLAFLEDGLNGDWLLDEFSLADISVGYMLFLLKITRNAGGFGDKTKAYFDRLRNRDAFRRASTLGT